MNPISTFYLCSVLGILIGCMMYYQKKMQLTDEGMINEQHKRLMDNIEKSVSFNDINNCESLFEIFMDSVAHRHDYQDLHREISNAIESKRCSIRAIQNVFDELKIVLN